MTLLGNIVLQLKVGGTVPNAAPADMIEAIDAVEVTHDEAARSGFQLTFQAARAGAGDVRDSALLRGPLLKPFSRTIVSVLLAGRPTVLIDGMITHRQLTPPSQAGGTPTLVVTGEDMSVVMDLVESDMEKPAQGKKAIVDTLLAPYAQYGVQPDTKAPKSDESPTPTDWVPNLHGTDLQRLTSLARAAGHIFAIEPGPAEGQSTAYWGPPREGAPQCALTVDMGGDTNVESLNFRTDATQPTTATAQVQDRKDNTVSPVQADTSGRPAMSQEPVLQANAQFARRRVVRYSGVSQAQAMANAQATVDASFDAVGADGELDGVRYGEVLQIRRPVEVRGAGFTYDGAYRVTRVTHRLARGEYTQRFSLARPGHGAESPTVGTC